MQHSSARLFQLDDIHWFATISGDPNPVHIDPEFAARRYPGAVVAHGAHLVLWALETRFRPDGEEFPQGLKAVFVKPVIAGDEVEVETAQLDTIRLSVRGEAVARIRLKAGRAPERWAGGAPPHKPSHPPVVVGPPASLSHVSGALRLPDSRDALLETFPSLGKRLGPRVLQGLSGIAPVSGGVLGGMTTEFSVQLSDDAPSENLEYRLVSHHAGFPLQLAFWGYGVIGEVAALPAAEPASATEPSP